MDSTSKADICIYSYNSRGSSEEKLDFISDFIDISRNQIPIFCIQEHFLLRNNLYKLTKYFRNSSVLSVPAFKDFNIQEKGRPKGGLSIIIPKKMRKFTKILKCDSWRIQPILLSMNNVKYLIINTYFPTDSKGENDDCHELEYCLNEIKAIININDFDNLYLVGDQNCEFSRSSRHVKLIKEFVEDTQMFDIWKMFPVDFTYSFECENGRSSFIVLDHIFTLKRSENDIIDAGVLHLVQNLSDHEVNYVKIKGTKIEVSERTEDKPVNAKPNWKTASVDQKLEYEDVLFRKLNYMEVPDCLTGCEDPNCQNSDHIDDIDKYVTNLLSSINDSAKETIPAEENKAKKSVGGRTKSMAGWKQFVEPFQQNAKFWHAIWVSAEKPVNTELHSIMKRTRNRFHYQIRRCRRVEQYLKNQKIIENCINDDKDLFAEVKRQRRSGREEDLVIDGVAGDEIPEKFATVYEELYNREEDGEAVTKILEKVNANIDKDSMKEINKVNIYSIKDALDKIKPNKSDPTWDFSSDFLKNGPELLFKHLEIMIKAFLIHGHVSAILLLATMVPIIKDKLGDLSSTKNYRSIAISSVILKLLDWLIINIFGHLLELDDFQFGFQPNSSTSLCSWVVYETIDHYIRNGSVVYGVLMDCTKAFDTVQHSTLFQKLLEAGLPPVLIRLMISIYKNQFANVRWKNGTSRNFSIKNGVRQGAVLSPIIFCFYVNNLFKELRRSRSGCKIGPYYAGGHGYADDLLLLCPSRAGLQEMVDIAAKYAKEHKIQFSTDPKPEKSKTKGMVFSRKPLDFKPAPIFLSGNALPWVEEAKYLGGKLTGIVDGFQQDVRIKRARFIERNCELNQEFYLAHPEIKCKLNHIYNSSFPGSILWDLTAKNTMQIINSWSVSVRHMWDLPVNSHRDFIESLGGTHAKVMLVCRYVNFVQSVQKSSKKAVLFLFNRCRNNVNTVTGKNINYIEKETRSSILTIKSSDIKKNYKFCEMKVEDDWKVNIVKEITNIKQNVLELESGEAEFTVAELNEILDFIVTS